MNDVVSLIIIALLNILPVLLWAGFFLRKDTKKEPKALLVYSFLLGGLATLPLFLVRGLATVFPTSMSLLGIGLLATMVTIVLGAFLEEMSKHLCALKAMDEDYEARNEVVDGIIYGIIVALGFSFVENSYYLWSTYVQQGVSHEFIQLYVVRSLITMFAHTVFSGFFGYFYAIAYIKPHIDVISHSSYSLNIKALWKNFHKEQLFFSTTRKVSKAKKGTLEHKEEHNAMEVVVEGLWAAVLLHVGYNVLLSVPLFGYSFGYLVVPYIAIFGVLLIRLLSKEIVTTSVVHTS